MRWRHGKVDVGRRLRGLDLCIQKSRLQVYDVLSQCVVLRFHIFVMLLHFVVLADLLLKFLDITLLALAECSLRETVISNSKSTCPR